MALAKKRVTLKEVAERAGVSRSAVSRTFTPGASVSDETRRRVENAAKALGYSPSVLASGLSTGRTKLIGLVSNNFRNPFYLEVFDAFTRTLQSRDLRPLLVNLSEQFDADDALAMLRQYSVDGVVVASSTLPPAFSSAFSDAGLPVVHAFARHSEIPDVNTVGIDNVACGRMAAELLMARGYGHVGFLGGPQTAASTADRQAGFLEALPAGVRAKCPVYHANDYSFQAGYAAMADIIAHGVSRRAWFCGDDAISIGAKAALEASAKSVPEDVGIVGVNGMDIAAWQGIELTTFRQPLQAIVDAVVERLAQLMEDPDDAPRAIRFEPQLIDGATLRQRPKNG